MQSPPLALVTGAAHRLGRLFAITLARQGYRLVLHYHRSAAEAARTRAEAATLGVEATLVQADLTDPVQIDRLFQTIATVSDSLQVLINSAAVMLPGDLRNLSIADWNLTLDLNLRAPFLLCQHAARLMTSGGLIVNVSDVGAHKTWTGFPAYLVSKAGLEALTRLLARALAPTIRVNALAPGLVLPGDQTTPDAWVRLVERTPLQRPARLEELASALEFLLKNEYITGHVLTLDGGYSLV